MKCPWLKRMMAVYVISVLLCCHGPVLDLVYATTAQSSVDVVNIVLLLLSVGANIAFMSFLAQSVFIVVRLCLILEFEAAALVEDVSDGVVDSWKSVCVLSRVINTTFERIRISCESLRIAVTDRMIFFTALLMVGLLVGVSDFFLSKIRLPTWIVGYLFIAFLYWFLMIVALGLINSKTNKLSNALQAERTRLTDQLGALSLTLASWDGKDFEDVLKDSIDERVEESTEVRTNDGHVVDPVHIAMKSVEQNLSSQMHRLQKVICQQHKMSTEMARLQTILARVNTLSSQDMDVAFLSGIPITQDMVKTVATKSLFVFYILLQFFAVYKSSLNFSESFSIVT